MYTFHGSKGNYTIKVNGVVTGEVVRTEKGWIPSVFLFCDDGVLCGKTVFPSTTTRNEAGYIVFSNKPKVQDVYYSSILFDRVPVTLYEQERESALAGRQVVAALMINSLEDAEKICVNNSSSPEFLYRWALDFKEMLSQYSNAYFDMLGKCGFYCNTHPGFALQSMDCDIPFDMSDSLYEFEDICQNIARGGNYDFTITSLDDAKNYCKTFLIERHCTPNESLTWREVIRVMSVTLLASIVDNKTRR